MLLDEFSRSRLLLGAKGVEKLLQSRVAVFGLGGVGGHAAEALARAGVGEFLLVDADTVGITNINRQTVADHTTVGRLKTTVMRERILAIHPAARVQEWPVFVLPDTPLDRLRGFDYLVDAVDTVAAKLLLARTAQNLGIPIISSMGAGNKLDPTRFEVADIYETSVCPLCRAMRRELKKCGVRKLKVVYSREAPAVREEDGETQLDSAKRQTPGSVPFVPSVAGMILAGQVVLDLTAGLRPGGESA